MEGREEEVEGDLSTLRRAWLRGERGEEEVVIALEEQTKTSRSNVSS